MNTQKQELPNNQSIQDKRIKQIKFILSVAMRGGYERRHDHIARAQLANVDESKGIYIMPAMMSATGKKEKFTLN